eukprot:12299831-Prorocentrum_lima.AAC.1
MLAEPSLFAPRLQPHTILLPRPLAAYSEPPAFDLSHLPSLPGSSAMSCIFQFLQDILKEFLPDSPATPLDTAS